MLQFFQRPNRRTRNLLILIARAVQSGAQGRDLIPVLEATGRTQLVAGLALSIGLLV